MSNSIQIETKVKNIINKVRPYLQNDGGDCEFVAIKDNIVYVKMLGACAGCSSMDVTLKDAIEAIILEEIFNTPFESISFFIY